MTDDSELALELEHVKDLAGRLGSHLFRLEARVHALEQLSLQQLLPAGDPRDELRHQVALQMTGQDEGDLAEQQQQREGN